MQLSDFLPVFGRLTEEERQTLEHAAVRRNVTAGTLLHNGSGNCEGLFCVESGQLRAFITSDEGREITLYRLFNRDICLFSASCMMSGIRFNVCVEAGQDSVILVIPSAVYRKVMEESAVLSNYTNRLMADHFTEVMWLIEQVLWKSFDRRLAAFLLEESAIEGSDTIHMTHERIADHLGTAREVVTRMLRYFQGEKLVRLNRGEIGITDRAGLQKLEK